MSNWLGRKRMGDPGTRYGEGMAYGSPTSGYTEIGTVREGRLGASLVDDCLLLWQGNEAVLRRFGGGDGLHYLQEAKAEVYIFGGCASDRPIVMGLAVAETRKADLRRPNGAVVPVTVRHATGWPMPAALFGFDLPQDWCASKADHVLIGYDSGGNELWRQTIY